MDLFGAGRKGSIGTGYRCRRSQPDESIRISRERFPGRDRDYHFGFPCAKGSRRFFRRSPNRIICPAIIVTAWEACAPRDVWSPPSGIWRGRGGIQFPPLPVPAGRGTIRRRASGAWHPGRGLVAFSFFRRFCRLRRLGELLRRSFQSFQSGNRQGKGPRIFHFFVGNRVLQPCQQGAFPYCGIDWLRKIIRPEGVPKIDSARFFIYPI